MAAFNKINLFTQDMCRGLHFFNSGGATYKAELSNTATVASLALHYCITCVT